MTYAEARRDAKQSPQLMRVNLMTVSGPQPNSSCSFIQSVLTSLPPHSLAPLARLGIHDGQLVVDGVTLGSNCDCKGFSRPTIIYTPQGADDDDLTKWDIKLQNRGEQLSGVQQGLAAGLSLVSFNGTDYDGASVDIPEDDDNINIYEHASNTAVGIIYDKLTGAAATMVMITVDGLECGPFDASNACGINSKNLANLILDEFGVHRAMSMDQGGSTTMWVKDAVDQGFPLGIVSNGGGNWRRRKGCC
jgi:hypothetical protein